VTIH